MSDLQMVVFQEAALETRPETVLDQPVDDSLLESQWSRARERYLQYVLKRKGTNPDELRHNTMRAYEIAISQFFEGVFDSYGVRLTPEVKPWLVTPGFVREWQAFMAQAGKPVFETRKVEIDGKTVKRRVEVGRAGLSATSVNLKLAALQGLYDFVQHKFEIPYYPPVHDPLLESDPPLAQITESRRHVRLWDINRRNPFNPKAIERTPVSQFGRSVDPTTAEVKRIFSQINLASTYGKRDYALLLAIFSTACRISEILQLKWGDLEPANKGHYVFRFRGKDGELNQVPLEAEAHAAIEAYLEAAGRLEAIGPDDYVFTALDPSRHTRLPEHRAKANLNPGQAPLAYDTARQILRKYAKHAGVDLRKAHLHGLRHAATLQTMEDMEEKQGAVDVTKLKDLLRHKNLNTTQVYMQHKKPPEDPWAKSRIAAVRPRGSRPRRPKAAPAAQIPLEAAISPEQAEIARLKAEIARLKADLGEQ